MGSTESQDQKPRLSFASRVRSSDVSFTPGFSPVMHEDDKTKNRFNGLLFGAKNEAVEFSNLRKLPWPENR
jgi:hypothetical protein